MSLHKKGILSDYQMKKENTKIRQINSKKKEKKKNIFKKLFFFPQQFQKRFCF